MAENKQISGLSFPTEEPKIRAMNKTTVSHRPHRVAMGQLFVRDDAKNLSVFDADCALLLTIWSDHFIKAKKLLRMNL